MILLETNVVSEAMRRVPERAVIEWIDAQPLETLWLSVITVAELRAGLALLPPGRRRDGLHESIERNLLPSFAGRILPFGLECTDAYARLLAQARAAGIALGMADAFVAASAVASGFAVATRDTTPFLAAGLEVINPWTAA